MPTYKRQTNVATSYYIKKTTERQQLYVISTCTHACLAQTVKRQLETHCRHRDQAMRQAHQEREGAGRKVFWGPTTFGGPAILPKNIFC